MSNIIRTGLVAIALLSTVSAASAHRSHHPHKHGYGHKHGCGHKYGHGHDSRYWKKGRDGKWWCDADAFFKDLKRNGS